LRFGRTFTPVVPLTHLDDEQIESMETMDELAAGAISPQPVQAQHHDKLGNRHRFMLGREHQRRGEMKVAHKRFGL